MPDTSTPPGAGTRAKAATELLARFTELYPSTFVHEGEPPQPLAIGISDQLIAALALDPQVVHTAMRLYTRRRAYQNVLAQDGAVRVDLAGQPTEPVAPEHQAAARMPRTPQAGQHAPAGSPLTWDEVQTIIQTLTTAPVGDASMKLTLVGRPGKVETKGQAVMFRMQGRPPGSLPKGLPPVPNAQPLTWTVIVAIRQWNRVKDSLETNADDQLILEGYPVMQGTQPVLMAQSCTSVALQRERKQAQQATEQTSPSA